jgi:hypothetical protein
MGTKWTNKDKLVSEIVGKGKILSERGSRSTMKSVNNGKAKETSKYKLGT